MPNETPSGDMPFRELASLIRYAAGQLDPFVGAPGVPGAEQKLLEFADQVERGEWRHVCHVIPYPGNQERFWRGR